MQQKPSTSTASAAVRVSLACVQCRSRHLRCDATTPTCARCVREGTECIYLKSRRGGRARAKPIQPTSQPTSPPLPLDQSASTTSLPRILPEQESVPSLIPAQSRGSSSSASSLGADEYAGISPRSESGPGYVTYGPGQEGAKCPLLELYYTFFHTAHPCALPLHFLRQKANEDVPGIRLLVLVLQYIGSLYAPKVSSAPLEEKVKAALAEKQAQPNGFQVQALVLYSISVYWCDDLAMARELLDEATDIALALGMNFREFAVEHSGGDPVLADSWRRTWWQLFMTDGHNASSSHAAFFRTSSRNVTATVDLPCEEAEYESGNIPPPRTLDDYDNREFATEEDSDFSSFAYVVGLGRSLDQTIIGIPRTSEENVKLMCTNADACISAWLSLLSKKKRRFFREDGTLDELLFKSNFLIQAFTVDIHRYLSTLAYSPIEALSSCAPPPPPKRLTPVYSRDAHIHTAKILRAIERLTDMLTLPVRIAVHTPFSICMIATMTIAHLSACKYEFKGEQLKFARERIRVAMGALEVFAEVWPRGRKVVGEVKTVARELLSLQPGTSTSPPSQPVSRTMSVVTSQSPQSQPQGNDQTRDTSVTTIEQYSNVIPGYDCSYFDFPGIGFESLEMQGFASNELCSDLSLKTGFPFDLDVPMHY